MSYIGVAPDQQVPLYRKEYTSPEQTITSAGALTLPHGLGVKPADILVYVVCKTAEFGYSVGDEIIVNPASNDVDATNFSGMSIVPDTTNVNIRYGNAGSVIMIANKTSGVFEGVTSPNWLLVVRAWAEPAPVYPVTEGIFLGTSVATTSGTSHDFTIPSGTKRLTMMVSGLSTNGVFAPLIQLGDSGGIETTGYSGSVSRNNSLTANNFTNGFWFTNSTGAASVMQGQIVLSLLNSSTNTWVAQGMFGYSNTALVSFTGGSKSLSTTLDKIRLTTNGGTDTFDAGTVNVSWEF